MSTVFWSDYGVAEIDRHGTYTAKARYVWCTLHSYMHVYVYTGTFLWAPVSVTRTSTAGQGGSAEAVPRVGVARGPNVLHVLEYAADDFF